MNINFLWSKGLYNRNQYMLKDTNYKETEELINKRFTYKKIKKATKIFDDLAAFVNWLEAQD